MNPNARSARQMVTKDGNPLAGITLGTNKNMTSISNTGEINAYDKQDALRSIQNLMNLAATGQVVEASTLPTEQKQKEGELRRSIMIEALESDSAWASLGSSLAEEINEQAERDSFLRRICQGQTLRQGDIPRVPMEQNITEAIVATSETSMGYQRLTAKVFNPTEFEIKANVRVAQLDLDQVSGDLLDKAYNDGLNGIMVKEDRMWKDAADKSVGMVNPVTYINGTLTPMYLSQLRTQVTGWSLPCSTVIISNDYWNDINGSPEWATMLDPITQHDLVLHGQIATLQGMTIITDGYRAPNLQVLGDGEIYAVADAQYHGSYSTRGGIKSTPTSGANDGDTSKGWLMHETFSFVLGNLRSVAKGMRI